MADAFAKGGYGRACETAYDGLLHIEGADDKTMCGEPIAVFSLHWDTRTVIVCGVCLMEAGVPLVVGPKADVQQDQAQQEEPHGE